MRKTKAPDGKIVENEGQPGGSVLKVDPPTEALRNAIHSCQIAAENVRTTTSNGTPYQQNTAATGTTKQQQRGQEYNTNEMIRERTLDFAQHTAWHAATAFEVSGFIGHALLVLKVPYLFIVLFWVVARLRVIAKRVRTNAVSEPKKLPYLLNKTVNLLNTFDGVIDHFEATEERENKRPNIFARIFKRQILSIRHYLRIIVVNCRVQMHRSRSISAKSLDLTPEERAEAAQAFADWDDWNAPELNVYDFV